ncbi:RNA polymerase sigma-54 factor RpoN [Labilithrix luteola]|uniref:RNA polymerase sigma-54 factor RpoN n=1 Tax=Labilithrix luteola TaxID=1391654 RepID=A0A0K1PY68_9BACT|nr:RNA polymerase sigma factor [Labilithrix luteola]AKU98473.1 RNA polymerase sigma-54 factor RpoN [Labilithrix luteola]
MSAAARSIDSLAALKAFSPSERALAGDPAEIRELIELLMPDAIRVAGSALGEHHPDLDDAVQLGLLAVIKQLPSFRGHGSFRYYAMRIVQRTAYALRRKSKRIVLLAEKMRADDGEEVADDASEPVDQSLRRVLGELFQTLPEAQAETFLLRVVLEYDVDEVAAETGVPVNTVRSRLRLAREALRRRIEADPRLVGLLSDSHRLGTKGRTTDE